jgi:hypothetical protein
MTVSIGGIPHMLREVAAAPCCCNATCWYEEPADGIRIIDALTPSIHHQAQWNRASA